MTEPIKTIHVGLGPIGLAVLRLVADRPWARIVGAVDSSPQLIGEDAGIVAGTRPLGFGVSPSLASSVSSDSADIVVHCAGSRLAVVTGQILEAIECDASVVSTCEELAYPWYHHREEALKIDQAAMAASQTVLATGINPGFAMDATAFFVSSACERIDRIVAHRVVDASTRRLQLQAKIGAGIPVEDFLQRRSEERIGHIGLLESVAMIGAARGWELDQITELIEPVISDCEIRTDHLHVPKGAVAGIRQVAHGFSLSEELVTLTLEMYVGASQPRDTVTLVGQPTITTTIEGLHGDISTAAIVTNALPAMSDLPIGLVTMIDAVPIRLRESHASARSPRQGARD